MTNVEDLFLHKLPKVEDLLLHKLPKVDFNKSFYITSNASVPLGFFSIADAFLMEIDKHQAMFRRYNRTFGE